MDNNAAPPRETPNYYKAAFLSPYNLIFLAGFGLLGLAFSGFWYVGAAVEVLYLGFVGNDPRFQRSVRSAGASDAIIDWRQQERDYLDRLTGKDASRYGVVQKTCAKIQERAAAVDATSSVLFETNLSKLGYLQGSFLRMLAALAMLREYLAETDPRQLSRAIDRLRGEAESAPEKVKEVKLQNVAILEQRLNHQRKASEQREFLEASLATLEDTLGLIGDNVVTMNNSSGIADQIDGVVTNMKENERLLGEMQAFMGTGREIVPESLPVATEENGRERSGQKVH